MFKSLVLPLIASLLLSLGGCFNDTPYTAETVGLTVNLVGQGEVLIEDYNYTCTPELGSCSLGYLRSQAETAMLIAKAYSGYQFTGWTGVEESREPMMKLVMDHPGSGVEITATFIAVAQWRHEP